jgi:hypothetical protein
MPLQRQRAARVSSEPTTESTTQKEASWDSGAARVHNNARVKHARIPTSTLVYSGERTAVSEACSASAELNSESIDAKEPVDSWLKQARRVHYRPPLLTCFQVCISQRVSAGSDEKHV